jgi:hypothetical protein
MNKRADMPECFACQGGTMLHGKSADECVDCDWFDKCHKMTVSASILCISDALDLMVQNGLADGRLKGFKELAERSGPAAGKK